MVRYWVYKDSELGAHTRRLQDLLWTNSSHCDKTVRYEGPFCSGDSGGVDHLDFGQASSARSRV